MSKRKPTIDYDNLFEQLSTTIEENLSVIDETLTIIDFVEQEVDLGITLTVQQRAVLKAFYNVPLTEEEESILQFWSIGEKSTWEKDARYQSLVLESGRRCIAGDSLIDTEMGLKDIKSLAGDLAEGEDREDLDFKVYVSGVGYVTPSNVFRLGVEDTLVITTKQGYSLEVTPDHRLYQNIQGSEVKTLAKALRVGDSISIVIPPTNLEFFGSEDRFEDAIVSIEPSSSDCYDFEIPKHHHYIANGIKSSNSGKTSLSAIITAYEFYMLCKMGSPQTHYGIATSTPISILVLATTATQAKKTIFKTVTGVFKNTKYFKKLENQGKLFIGKEEISYEDKLLYVYSGNSQSGSQVGGTMKAMIMDEVARFKDSDGESNALELWSNLGIATTTFGKDARRIAISSAWFDGDAIQTLYEGTKSDPTGLGIRTASWDMNPIHAARDNPIVASEYATNPVKAALEFEGVRPAAVDAFLEKEEVVKAFTGKCAITFTSYKEEENGFLLQKLKIDSCQVRKAGTVVHIDPAIKKDSYALGFGHNEFDDKGRQVVVIAGLLGWEPEHDSQVSITDVQRAVLELHKYRCIEKLSSDHYNSAETIQRLRSYGIKCESQHYSNRLQVAMYDLVRMLLHENRLILPYDSKLSSKLKTELIQLQLIKGQKIDHPKPLGSKDYADCVASICWNLADRITKDKLGGAGAISSVSIKQNDKPEGLYINTASSNSKHKILSNLRGRNNWFANR